MTQEEIWIPGSIFRMAREKHEYYNQYCSFLGWDDNEGNQDPDYDYRYPQMKFSDGTIEDQWDGENYEFISLPKPFYCKSLL